MKIRPPTAKPAASVTSTAPTPKVEVEVIKPSGVSRDTATFIAPIATSALDMHTNALADKISLPTDKFAPAKNIYDFAYYIYGYQKIGKTSFSTMFPDVAHLFYEPSGEDYEVLSIEPPTWDWFKAFVVKCERLKAEGALPYKMFAFDIVDVAYVQCLKSVCNRSGHDFPPNDYGKTWDKIDDEFRTWMFRLRKLGGVIFLSHAKTDGFNKADGNSVSKIIPSCKPKCHMLLSKFCTMTAYYFVDSGGNRVLGITPNSEYEAGHRFKNHFKYKGTTEPVTLISMGTSEEEAYRNFTAGFNNALVKPVVEVSTDKKTN